MQLEVLVLSEFSKSKAVKFNCEAKLANTHNSHKWCNFQEVLLTRQPQRPVPPDSLSAGPATLAV